MLIEAASFVNESVDWLLNGIDYFAYSIFPGLLDALILFLSLLGPLLNFSLIACGEFDFGDSEVFFNFLPILPILVIYNLDIFINADSFGFQTICDGVVAPVTCPDHVPCDTAGGFVSTVSRGIGGDSFPS